MLMLTAYLDETGHSADKNQKFVGMGGLIATSKNWELFEKKWKKVLRKYDVSCLHMKDFAHSRKDFEKWKDNKPIRDRFLGELMEIIKEAGAFPFGCSIPLDSYRKHPKYLQNALKNPYYIAFMFCGMIMSYWVEPLRRFNETIAPVFAEQTEFQYWAMRMYEGLKRNNTISDLIDSPVFRPMKKFVPLQAADFVAYEAQKETYRRLYTPDKKPRWGWEQLQLISQIREENTGFNGEVRTGFIFPSEESVAEFMTGIQKGITQSLLRRH